MLTSKLVEIGGINEDDVIAEVKNYISTGEWEEQKKGLVNALSGAKINGIAIDKRTLGSIIHNAIHYSRTAFEGKMNRALFKR
ncbi:MAG: hypothetical protein LBS55_01345 [Prevotellaceae bacterium]|jgi:hypothetical protein|nr:hypothetical protein [Prevotellaceae bacterium]